MVNRLVIDNFLIFGHIEISVNVFTVFIGPQASGKSVAAKLLYLFYHFPEFAFTTIIQHGGKRELKKRICDAFLQIFPEPIWRNQAFTITFHTDCGTFAFAHEAEKALSFTYSENYDKLIGDLIRVSIRQLADASMPAVSANESIRRNFHKADWGLINNGTSCTFIPAGRSFFASLQNNFFTLLANNIQLDYFIKNFGSLYERFKWMYANRPSDANAIDMQMALLGGTYTRKRSIDFISTGHGGLTSDIPIALASSGQQELLPILMAIFSNLETFFIFEEPEAHIFPESQARLLRAIVSTRNPEKPGQAYLFTTHSPYVLTTLNNLAYAGKLAARLTGEPLTTLDGIYPCKERIPADALSAYHFDRGVVADIIDPETRIINAECLDTISTETEDKFSALLDLEMQLADGLVENS